jgi:hypothetical protein
MITGAGRDKINEIYNGYLNASKKMSPDQVVDLRSFLKDIASVKNTISKSAREGSRRFSQEDISGAILDKNWGEFASKRLPEFADLQKDYSQIVDAMNLSNSIFKPYKGELYTDEGVKLLQRYGLMKKGEENATTRLLEKMQRGGELAPGTGDITTILKETGENIRGVSQKILDTEMRAKEILLKNEGVYLKNKTKLDNELEKRLGQLALRELKAAQATTNQQKILAMMKTVGWIGGIVSGGYALGRISGEIADILKK